MASSFDSFAYINRTYGLTLRRGSRVEYTGEGMGKRGTVTSADGAHVNVLFDGDTTPCGPFHPTWEMRQIVEPSNV